MSFNFNKKVLLSGVLLVVTVSASAIALGYFLPQIAVAQSSVSPPQLDRKAAATQKLIGIWQGSQPGTPTNMIIKFKSDGTLHTISQQNGTYISLLLKSRYNVVNASTNIVQVNTDLDDINNNKKRTTLKGIVEFLGQNNLRLNLGEPGKAFPKTFDPKTTLTLTRQDLDAQVPFANLENIGQAAVEKLALKELFYYSENGRFSGKSQIPDLPGNNYYFAIIPDQKNPRQLKITATPKADGLRSFSVGLIHVDSKVGELEVLGGQICRSNQPTKIAPGMPTSPEDIREKLQCPSGYSAL